MSHAGRIFHFNVTDWHLSGAARLMLDLDAGLRAAGLDSRVITPRNQPPRPLLQKIRARLSRPRAKRQPPFTGIRSTFTRLHAVEHTAADIAHLHWTGDWLDWPSFFAGWKGRIVVTLHDAAVFTGGCHVPGDCEKHLEGCGRCPQLASRRASDPSARQWREKRALLRSLGPRLALVAPSGHFAALARRSLLADRLEVKVVRNGIRPSIFARTDRASARRILDLDTETGPVALVVATHLDQPHKRVPDALGAVAALPGSLAVLIGENGFTAPPGLRVRAVGPVSDPRLLSLYYAAADVFVSAAHSEPFGLALAEAVACRTPFASLPVGVAAELAGAAGETCASADLLPETIRLALARRESYTYPRLGIEDCIRGYLDLYREAA